MSAWLAAATDRRSRSAPRNRCTRRAARQSRRAAASRRSRRRSGRIRRARAHRREKRFGERGYQVLRLVQVEQEGFSRTGDRMLRAPGPPHTALTQRRSAQVNTIHFRSILFTANGGHHGGRHDRPAAGRHWRARAVVQPVRRRGKRPPRAHPRACRRGGPRAYAGLAAGNFPRRASWKHAGQGGDLALRGPVSSAQRIRSSHLARPR